MEEDEGDGGRRRIIWSAMPITLAVNQEQPGCKSSGDGQREVANDSEDLNDLEALT